MVLRGDELVAFVGPSAARISEIRRGVDTSGAEDA